MDWQQRIAAVWAEADALDDAELVRRIDDIAAEHPDEPLALVDLGRPVEAVAALLLLRGGVPVKRSRRGVSAGGARGC